MKDRILWLDNLKGFLIFMVVLGHTILFTNNDGDSNIFYRYISSFWMALFMFTSGFACYKVKPSYKLIWKRFKQLIIPFICWSLILSIINRSNDIVELLLYPSKSVWFLWALFFINSIAVIACNIANSHRISEEILCFVIIVILFIVNKEIKNNNIFALNLICLHFINFIIGYFSRKHFDSITKLPHVVFYGCGLAFLLTAYFNYGSFMPFGLPSSLHVFYSILCGFLSFPLFTSLFMKVKFPALLSRIGGGTLGIYVVHIGIYTVIRDETLMIGLNMNGCIYAIYVLILALIVFCISMVICKIIDRIHILSILLLGK